MFRGQPGRSLLAGAGRRWTGWFGDGRPLLLYLAAAVVGALALGALGVVLAAAPVKPGSTDKVVFEVHPGEGASTIASSLENQGLIRDRFDFRLLSALFGWNRELKVGRYEVSPGYSTWRILRQIGRGQVITVPLTIPEGYTVAQIESLLVEKGFATKESFRQALQELGAEGKLPFLPPAGERKSFIEPYEGVFFPSTYYFEESASAKLILETMARTMEAEFTPELRARAQELGMTPWQVLTLASIIEKEAAKDEERPIISSVYHNRLDIGMKLDACPTVYYVTKKSPDEPLLFADLEVVSPYNTYQNAGLPPGPIANPGLASIRAALYPASTDYFYFVSKNDGTHAFSCTLEEHNRAVQKYQGGQPSGT